MHGVHGSQRPDQSRNRRDFIKLGALAGLGAAIGCTGRRESVALQRESSPGPAGPFAAAPMEHVRIGYVGVGALELPMGDLILYT